MTIGEQLELRQPEIYNFLIDCFGLDMRKTTRKKPIQNFIEDDPEFRRYRHIMTEKSSAQKGR